MPSPVRRTDIRQVDRSGSDREKEDTFSTKILYIEEGGAIYVRGADGPPIAGLDGKTTRLFLGKKGQAGYINIFDHEGREVLHVESRTARLDLGAQGNGGLLAINDKTGKLALSLDGDEAKLAIGTQGHAGLLAIHDKASKLALSLDGDEAKLTIGVQGNGGTLTLLDGKGSVVLTFNPAVAGLYVGGQGNEGDVIVRNQAEKETIKLDGGQCTVSVRNEAGTETIRLDGKTGDVLLLGADCAEEFEVIGGDQVDAGTVLVIHDEGTLCPCVEAYDRRVAGVVSGAKGLNPGIILGRSGAQEGRQPIALSGRVFCKVDAGPSPIQVGDLLTTSPLPGHAMKATDATRAFGAVIGKALRSLESGRGLIPILVGLQ